MIYEERTILLAAATLPGFRRYVHQQLWPEQCRAGHRPLCLLSGLIGAPVEEVHLFTGYRDAGAWEQAQSGSIPAAPAQTVIEERVRLWRPSDVRPKTETPPEDQRAVYGMRRFFIRPGDWPDFVRHSAEGIWVRIEQQDARILGLFRDAAATDPLEVTLLTGYHGPAHWQATRATSETPAPATAEAWAQEEPHRGSRQAMTLRTSVSLMRAHWPG